MIDDRELFERAVERFDPPERSFERLVTRRDRKHRNKRITAAVLAFVVAAAGFGALLRAFTSGPPPVGDPTERFGVFAPIAGRILYENEAEVGDLGYDVGLWAIDPNGPSDTAAGPSVAEDVASTLARLDVEEATPLGWSNDGTELLLLRSIGDGFFPEQVLSILHVDGSETRLNPDPMGITSAAISPDGTRVVFAGQYDVSGLFVIDAEGGEPVQLPIPQAQRGAGSPTFSPDGSQIAFLVDTNVWVANADGTDAHEILASEPALTGDGASLQWSPAGDRLAIQVRLRNGDNVIFTFAPDGSDLTRVITGALSPHWSPDGSRIAYTIECELTDPSCGGLAIADADGSNVREFGFAASGPWHPGVSAIDEDTTQEPSVDLGIFAPIVGRIVYYSDSSLWAVDPNAPSPISRLVRVDLGGTADADRFASFTRPLGWSSDGTKLLFLREDPTDDTFPYDLHLYILHADGTETQVVPEPVSAAALSPDGTQVVYATDASEGLFVVDADGGQPVRISAFGEEPTFSPDGTQIGFLGLPRDGCCVPAEREHVWVANADGSDAHEILVNEPALDDGANGLTWSPTDDRIAMDNAREGHVAIYTFASDGSGFTRVVTDGAGPFWSPDGSQIAYEVLDGSLDGLRILDADGVRIVGVGRSGPWHPGTLETLLTTRPSPAQEFSTFHSALHGIAIDYPTGWNVRPATEPWNYDTVTFASSNVDVLFDPSLGDDLYLALASEPLGGRSGRDWVGGAFGRICADGGGWEGEPGTIESATGWIGSCGSASGNGHFLAVATGKRGYLIYLHVADERTLYETLDFFDDLVKTADLGPVAARDEPSPSASP
jgi:Tol biopolymer transport system component